MWPAGRYLPTPELREDVHEEKNGHTVGSQVLS